MSESPYGAQPTPTRMICLGITCAVFALLGAGLIIAGLVGCNEFITRDAPQGFILGLSEAVFGFALLCASGFIFSKYGPTDKM